MKNIYCSFAGHRLIVSKNVTFHVKEYTCINCNLKFTTNGKGKLTELTPKFEEINRVLSNIYSKRRKRQNIDLLS